MANTISLSDFKSRFLLKNRTITLSTGDEFVIKPLNMMQKRTIREDNMKLNMVFGRKGESKEAQLDIEGMIIDTVIAASVEPKFNESDKEWMQSSMDSAILQELYEKIETPIKLANMDDVKLGK